MGPDGPLMNFSHHLIEEQGRCLALLVSRGVVVSGVAWGRVGLAQPLQVVCVSGPERSTFPGGEATRAGATQPLSSGRAGQL